MNDPDEEKNLKNNDVSIKEESSNKLDSITSEGMEFIRGILKTLSQLMVFKKELNKEFQQENEINAKLSYVFRDIEPLHSVYKMIIDNIDQLDKEDKLLLPELFLKNDIKNSLNFYKSFLNQYAINSKWIGEFYRMNQKCQEVCKKSLEITDADVNINPESCLYTIFNSLFAFELLFDRYSKCFSESDSNFQQAKEVKCLIRNILVSIPQDQESFFKTQNELNLLSGKTIIPKINTKFMYKGSVTKYSKKDNSEYVRQLVLFSDCLYVTVPSHNINGINRVRQELSLKYMNVSIIPEDELHKGKLQWGLNINTLESNKEFYFDDEKKLKTWKNFIESAIRSEKKPVIDSNPIAHLGEQTPTWQKDDATDYCNGLNCCTRFTIATRRHHCRADGLIYCDSCSSYRLKLKFEKSESSRLCELCYIILGSNPNPGSESSDNIAKAKRQLNSVFERKTRRGLKLSWLKVRDIRSQMKSSVEYFCELDVNHPFLKLYKNFEDKIRQLDIILLGMKVTTGNQSKYFHNLKSNQFIIEHIDKIEAYLFKASDATNRDEWVECLQNSIEKYCDG